MEAEEIIVSLIYITTISFYNVFQKDTMYFCWIAFGYSDALCIQTIM